MTEASTLSGNGSDFVAYEYTTIRVERDLEPLYKDAYANFGWIVEGYGPSLPNVSTVTLKLKRDRRIKNRPMVLELQRKCENALRSITSLEKAKTTTAMAWSLSLGIVGSAFLAGAVFAIDADLIVLSIPLGAIGLVGWLAGYLAHGRVKANKTTQLAPLIDRQYDVVYETGEQASHLLA
jgi:F0F1-type ATP synthase assembly protein I